MPILSIDYHVCREGSYFCKRENGNNNLTEVQIEHQGSWKRKKCNGKKIRSDQEEEDPSSVWDLQGTADWF
jgi:hypothetical protein